jgi:starch synthase (maltosyl-transferring)
MTPAAGECQVAYVGDWAQFEIRPNDPIHQPETHTAFLRTNLGRAEVLQKEIVQRTSGKNALALFSWQDIPMEWQDDRWVIRIPLAQVGYFRAKPYLLDQGHHQIWPEGKDSGLSVHPNFARTSNTIYCAWVRLFGDSKFLPNTESQRSNSHHQPLDEKGYSVIPPSGKIRDLIKELPHIIDTLGSRIIHLLPINPTPTTYARFGRFGSPYAAQNLMAVDPALVEFDHASTGIDQFQELTEAVHAKGARLFIDLVANHTGWGADIHENHPDWYERESSGKFISPGAWGNTWGDLVELKQDNPEVWEYLAEVFLTWCRRGVDGFRCDAGYMVPVEAWQLIVSRVREEYPNSIFLLEGLGGAWESTENLLTDGGMQWAYSELFQEFSGPSLHKYLEHCAYQSPRVGTLVHYSETHDNNRLASKGRQWSLSRNRLCALTSVNGGYAFTCGVEWLAAEKIIVHECTGMNWGADDNIVFELARLNRILTTHPCFFDGAQLKIHDAGNESIYLMERVSSDESKRIWIIANTHESEDQLAKLDPALFNSDNTPPLFELLGQEEDLDWQITTGAWSLTLQPGAVFCLSYEQDPALNDGAQYRKQRAQSAMALQCLSLIMPIESIPFTPWQELANCVEDSLPQWLASISNLHSASTYLNVIEWSSEDRARFTPVPMNHWIVIKESHPFSVRLTHSETSHPVHMESVPCQKDHVAVFWAAKPGDLLLEMKAYSTPVQATNERLIIFDRDRVQSIPEGHDNMALLTNGRGAMSRVHAGLEEIHSKYDCLLGANLHDTLPVDRHVFIKRIRIWVNADGFITPLNRQALLRFDASSPARWRFFAPAGNGRSVEIALVMDMLKDSNAVIIRLTRPKDRCSEGDELPDECRVSLTVRFDIEDRNFHWETQRNESAEHHFNQNIQSIKSGEGFLFSPDKDRQLKVWTDAGQYHPAPEWIQGVPHPVEQSRGQTGQGDAFSPGWFNVPLSANQTTHLIASAAEENPSTDSISQFPDARNHHHATLLAKSSLEEEDRWGRQLLKALDAFVVKRDDGMTVIAGYPWFLDWGRDSLIVARGMLSGGMTEEVVKLLIVFGRFESHGTLPNTIHGANASNRDTSDAPLWYGVLSEETAAIKGASFYQTEVDHEGKTIQEVLFRIATGIMRGTPNGIQMDKQSGLVWSPSHFTWMDTNYPAGTPREGYPVEIQALWIRLLRLLNELFESADASSRPAYMEPLEQTWKHWLALAKLSFDQLYWIEEKGWPADVLIGTKGTPAKDALRDQALRSNCLWSVSLGCMEGDKARSTVEAARRYLVIPGALRSLAPLPPLPHLPIYGKNGDLLNDPAFPYWGRYEGDEDTRRKPAYHNGTAWVWTFPTFCEALAEAWKEDPVALDAALDYLASMSHYWIDGCSGQLPEVVDGDAPHYQRGCDAQAWSVSEALRVWKKIRTSKAKITNS